MIDEIICRNVSTHNLKNIDVRLKLGQWIAITGVSGSGKSSLAFDTIYAESQRRFLETLGTYERQFLQGLPGGVFDKIENLPAAIALKQTNKSTDPRAVIATASDLAEPLRNLFAIIMDPSCAVCGTPTTVSQSEDLVQYCADKKNSIYLVAKYFLRPDSSVTPQRILTELLREGLTQILWEGTDEVQDIEDLLQKGIQNFPDHFYLVLDEVSPEMTDTERENRIESTWSLIKFSERFSTIYALQTPAKKLGFQIVNKFHVHPFCEKCQQDSKTIQNTNLDWQTTLGGCEFCTGLGVIPKIDPEKVVPNPKKSLEEDAIKIWTSEKFQWMKQECLMECQKRKIPTDIPYEKLTLDDVHFIWHGDAQKKRKNFVTIEEFFEVLESERYKSSSRILLAKYRKYITCPACQGKRVSQVGRNAQCQGKTYPELFEAEIQETRDWFYALEYDSKISSKLSQVSFLYEEVKKKLQLLCDLGLGTAHLFRRTRTLSGGEFQRVLLSRVIGNGLTDALYVLDEPSVGLGQSEIPFLVESIQKLKALGNTILMVEHDVQLIQAADFIIEMGPKGGVLGGEILPTAEKGQLFSDKVSEETNFALSRFQKNSDAIFSKGVIELEGFSAIHCQNLNVKIPLEKLTVITGPSGSGKTTLATMGLQAALEKFEDTGISYNDTENRDDLIGAYDNLILPDNFFSHWELVCVGQKAAHRTITSTPATLFGAMDFLRKNFYQASRELGVDFTLGDFSFNAAGACQECGGKGFSQDDLFFLGTVEKNCGKCQGTRYRDEVLDISYGGKNISEWLNLTVDEWMRTLGRVLPNTQSLRLAQSLGLGHLPMGIPTSQISGGEAGRLRLCATIGKMKKKIFCLLDEPTRGLSEWDIGNLLVCFRDLTQQGHTIVVVEHHPLFQAYADFVIQMGPGGGQAGGQIISSTY